MIRAPEFQPLAGYPELHAIYLEEISMEPVSAVLVTFGLAILLASWVMLIITSFNEDFTWGLSAIFLPPLAYFYGLFQWAKSKDAILFAILGCILLFLA